jgi:hypothetical protein
MKFPFVSPSASIRPLRFLRLLSQNLHKALPRVLQRHNKKLITSISFLQRPYERLARHCEAVFEDFVGTIVVSFQGLYDPKIPTPIEPYWE